MTPLALGLLIAVSFVGPFLVLACLDALFRRVSRK